MDLATVTQAAGAAASAGGDGGSSIGFLRDIVDLLKTGGPYALSVLAGWWALIKDREKNEAVEKAAAAAKASYDQMVSLVAAQTTALVKMEATIGALKDVIAAQDRRRERDRG